MAKYIMALDVGTTSNRCILSMRRARCAVWHRRNLRSFSKAGLGGA